ncbi:hypothetical protein BDV36DRAFT_152001 [Aspergillus pseudocaelatus]|uniref:Uncharacterized protein n=1 Tax=Aspergillus pseudocaelatus TaxID=1825620 RepID=A0ABQ6WNL0_9EURO|nr:hypothetical protein BDV36DRAFT_152001 [Aspergillus pseudocaelatus]
MLIRTSFSIATLSIVISVHVGTVLIGTTDLPAHDFRNCISDHYPVQFRELDDCWSGRELSRFTQNLDISGLKKHVCISMLFSPSILYGTPTTMG